MDFIERISSYRINYFILAGLIIISWRQSDTILNYPNYLKYFFYILAFGILLLGDLKKNRIENTKMKKKKENYFLSKILKIGIIAFFSIIFGFIIQIPLNFIIKLSSKGTILVKSCEISNYVSGRNDIVYFVFNDKKESYHYSINGIKRNDIINNHLLRVEYKESILGTYIVEDINLIQK